MCRSASAARWAGARSRRWRWSGLGIRRLSITPAGVGPVKAMIRSLDAGAATRAMDRLLKDPPADFRAALAAWAERHQVAMA